MLNQATIFGIKSIEKMYEKSTTTMKLAVVNGHENRT